MAAPISDQKRFWKIYTEFKLWAATPDPTSKRFKIENDSYEDPSLLQNRKASALSMQVNSAIVRGLIYPSSDPFKNHALRVQMDIPLTFPQAPPKIYMLTRIRHPNIDTDRTISIAALDLHKTFKSQPLSDIARQITTIIDNPEASHVVDAEMGSLYDFSREEYNKKLTELVIQYGVPRI